MKLNQNKKDRYTDLTDQSRIRQISQSQSVSISLMQKLLRGPIYAI
jgi:hypothetical protein